MKDEPTVAVIGTGYVGLVTAAVLARVGAVIGIDVDPAKIKTLQDGRVPFHEPGLPELVQEATAAGRLTFTTDVGRIADAQQIFIAVGTPEGPDGAPVMDFIRSAMDSCIAHARKDAVVAIRSTVPPGTGDELTEQAQQAGRDELSLVSVPEFLAEGTAVQDFLHTKRIVVGGQSSHSSAVAERIRSAVDAEPEIHLVNRATAELAKYAANTFLAARVSLINEFANLCEAAGGDIDDLARIVGSDPRVGPLFLRAGIGYGGSCFPKDVQAAAAFGRRNNVPTPVVEAVHQTNQKQIARVIDTATRLLDGSSTVAIWGIAFKPGTDDIREAPSLRIAQGLIDAGHTVRMSDPLAKTPDGLAVDTASPLDAVAGADLLVLATEWPEFTTIDPASVAAGMERPVVLDGRNALDRDAWQAAGFTYHGIGRGAP